MLVVSAEAKNKASSRMQLDDKCLHALLNNLPMGQQYNIRVYRPVIPVVSASLT